MNDQKAHDISEDMEGGKNDPFPRQLIDNLNAYMTL